jgi:hypothetical protein
VSLVLIVPQGLVVSIHRQLDHKDLAVLLLRDGHVDAPFTSRQASEDLLLNSTTTNMVMSSSL